MGIKVRIPIPLTISDFGQNRWKICMDSFYLEASVSESKEIQVVNPSQQKNIQTAIAHSYFIAKKHKYIFESNTYKYQLRIHGLNEIKIPEELMAWSFFLCFAYFTKRTINRTDQLQLLTLLYPKTIDHSGIQASILGGLSVTSYSLQPHKAFRLPLSSSLFYATQNQTLELISSQQDYSFSQFELQHALTLHSIPNIKSSLTSISQVKELDKEIIKLFSNNDCLGIIRTKENLNIYVFSTSLALDNFMLNLKEPTKNSFVKCTLDSEGTYKC